MAEAVSSSPATPPIGAAAAREVRTHLRGHLAASGLAPDDIERLVLAAWEAAVNVAEHGGGLPELVVSSGWQGACVTILDAVGSPPPRIAAHGDAASERGRGVLLIAAGAGVGRPSTRGATLHLAVGS